MPGGLGVRRRVEQRIRVDQRVQLAEARDAVAIHHLPALAQRVELPEGGTRLDAHHGQQVGDGFPHFALRRLGGPSHAVRHRAGPAQQLLRQLLPAGAEARAHCLWVEAQHLAQVEEPRRAPMEGDEAALAREYGMHGVQFLRQGGGGQRLPDEDWVDAVRDELDAHGLALPVAVQLEGCHRAGTGQERRQRRRGQRAGQAGEVLFGAGVREAAAFGAMPFDLPAAAIVRPGCDETGAERVGGGSGCLRVHDVALRCER